MSSNERHISSTLLDGRLWHIGCGGWMEGGRDEGSASDRGAIEIESETAEPQIWANLFINQTIAVVWVKIIYWFNWRGRRRTAYRSSYAVCH